MQVSIPIPSNIYYGAAALRAHPPTNAATGEHWRGKLIVIRKLYQLEKIRFS
ncbi:MAG: hypothetical protein ABL983_09390 [Nitrospira sp.]